MPTLFIVLFIVSLLPMLLAFIGGYLRYKQFGGFDNNHPRQQQAQLTGLASRVLAAQKNAWEALIFFTAGCFLAFASSIDLDSLSYASVLFLICRMLHPIFYMLDQATFRSSFWIIGWLANLYIAIMAVTSF